MASVKVRRDAGTSVRRTPDVRALGLAFRQPGIDPRTWVSYGTVCTWDDAGKCDFSDNKAIYLGPEGVEVDVILEPSGVPVTCHYYGVQGGCEATMLTPIRPGDRVVVVLPSGDPTNVPVIAAILHSAYCKVPIEDNQLVFKNDKVLVWSETTDIEIRTKQGARLDLKQDDTANVHAARVNLGSPEAGEQLVLGTTYRPRENEMLVALGVFAQAVNLAIASDPVILPPLKAAVASTLSQLNTKLQALIADLLLSNTSRTD